MASPEASGIDPTCNHHTRPNVVDGLKHKAQIALQLQSNHKLVDSEISIPAIKRCDEGLPDRLGPLQIADEEFQYESTGTWRLVAARLLTYSPNGQASPAFLNDIESFHHLMTWVALPYTSHILEDSALSALLFSYFESSIINPETGRVHADLAKQIYLSSESFLDMAGFCNDGVYALLQAPQEALLYLKKGDWLTNLLKYVLDDPNIDWTTHGEMKAHAIVDVP
ncbi:hypothetical protein Hypma_001717 [Hypsizygus marmoreus]|uniref:Fungal-type protein kinase domain-containing protein n=1 Tax=Hypsizygus marmoreus TaxID=39966 RepID=A0A369JCC5_HYPMA|nr:hypothetical protein Hypma_001717 [Hypsizygus marmoreus]